MKNKKKGDTAYERYFKLAERYYRNAKDIIKDIPVELGRYYKDIKGVQKSAGVCYLAMDYAIKGYLIKIGIDEKKVLSLTWDGLKSMLIKYFPKDGKFRKELEIAYMDIHQWIYYRAVNDVNILKEGYGKVRYVIERLTGRNLG